MEGCFHGKRWLVSENGTEFVRPAFFFGGVRMLRFATGQRLLVGTANRGVGRVAQGGVKRRWLLDRLCQPCNVIWGALLY